MSKPLLQAREIHKRYRLGQSDVPVLRGATLDVAEGEFLVIMGASGCGKSTLLHLLGALDSPDRGTVHFRGLDLFALSPARRDLYRNQHVGFVFQFYHLLPELTVLENVLLPRMVAKSVLSWARTGRNARSEAEIVLERVGLSHRLGHKPNQLSGGERQRVAIARALANRPSLLLADEPTGNLDEEIGGEILRLLTELNESGQTIVMVTHDPRVAARAHRQVRLSEGTIHAVAIDGVKRSTSPVLT